jgi:inorganic triphosphatase YgiF
MGAEVELKLALSPAALRRAERLPWLRSLATSQLAKADVTSTYFDTRKRKLRRHGVVLRVRKVESKRVQTIKSTSSAAGALSRAEQEDDIGSDTPDLAHAKHTPLGPLVTRKLKKQLHPAFATMVRRATLNVHLNDSDIALAFDRGKLVSGQRSEPVHELELELTSGDPADLGAFARRLAGSLPLAFGALSKADRGYALMDGSEPPVHATAILLDPDQTAGAAFAQIGLSCLQHLAGNERAVLAGNPEGVHQMRVGIRRLRAAISLFRAIVSGKEADDIKRELKWLGEQLGPARDLDVLEREAITPLRKDNPDKPEIDVLAHDVERDRRGEFRHARETVAGDRFRRIVLTAALWLIDGDWSRSKRGPAADCRTRPVASVAADILERRSRKIIKKAGRLTELDDRGRHKLRIAVKKLRYGCAFFESLFGHRRRRQKYLAALKGLQGCLGKLNDIRVHAGRARRIANAPKPKRGQPRKAYAMGFLTGAEQARRGRLLAAAGAAAETLGDARPFW